LDVKLLKINVLFNPATKKEIAMATTRIKKTLSAIPASVIEAMRFLASIGEKQRAINKVKADLRIDIEKLKITADKKLKELTLDRNNFFTALFAFASSNKQELTLHARSQKGKEGTFGWRWTTPYVEIKEGVSDEDVILALKKKGLTKYIRVIEELDREAMLRDQPNVPNVSYMQRDEFFARPALGKGNGRSEELVKKEKTSEAIKTGKTTEAVDI
jgi:phage host-nuclease inhibitor protein Gam